MTKSKNKTEPRETDDGHKMPYRPQVNVSHVALLFQALKEASGAFMAGIDELASAEERTGWMEFRERFDSRILTSDCQALEVTCELRLKGKTRGKPFISATYQMGCYSDASPWSEYTTQRYAKICAQGTTSWVGMVHNSNQECYDNAYNSALLALKSIQH